MSSRSVGSSGLDEEQVIELCKKLRKKWVKADDAKYALKAAHRNSLEEIKENSDMIGGLMK